MLLHIAEITELLEITEVQSLVSHSLLWRGYSVAWFVQTVSYKSEGCRFQFRGGNWNFELT
jgi:hypothetical protein